jgi:nucleoside-diphosphate-sugar epimerase
MRPRVLVTGASGFVGCALLEHLVSLNACEVIAMTRVTPENRVTGVRYLPVGDLALQTSWPSELAGVDTVVHAAARVHILNDRSTQSVDEFERVNVIPTLELARHAAAVGVRRFVFLSSIGVNGVQTQSTVAFSETDTPNPHNAYALSKLQAERGLQKISLETGLEVVIIRPPLVYGPGVRANFAALMHAVRSGWPLPLGAVHNQRSLVALDNLVDFIVTCIEHPQAANETFLVSDGDDVSSAELVRGLARAAGVSARLLPVPVWFLWAGAVALGKREFIQRLCGSLQVDINKARTLLGWVPKISLDEGLRRAVAGIRKP